jgi:hypothetical protein
MTTKKEHNCIVRKINRDYRENKNIVHGANQHYMRKKISLRNKKLGHAINQGYSEKQITTTNKEQKQASGKQS